MFGSNIAKLEDNEELQMIKFLDKDELYELINNDDKINGLIHNSGQVTNIARDKENLITSNKSLAEYNLSFEPKLLDAKQKLSTSYAMGIEIQKNYEDRKLELDSRSANKSLDTVLALLQTECAKSEEESETLSDQFIAGNIELEEFLEQFSATRKLYHMRKIKSEKMTEMLREQTAQRNRPPPPPVQNNGTPTSNNSAPYSQYYNVVNNWSNFQNNQYPAYTSYSPR